MSEGSPGYRPFPAFADWASLAINTAVYDSYAGILDRLREHTDPDRLARAIETATRLAAIDTGAIEGLYEVDRGFTMTVAVQSATWEAAIDAREPVVRRSFEDALRAYDFVLDIATGRTEISEKAIREIHSLICASQDEYRVYTSLGWQVRPLPHAEYKTLSNNPTRTSTGRVHAYAPPSDTPAEMGRLVGELRSALFQEAHPILQAAYAHYTFVAIHPFADGNGRVARALASAYLYRRPGVPLVIFADQKDEYIDALEHADADQPQSFVNFIAERVADIVGIVQVASAKDEAPSASASLTSLRQAFVSREGIPLEELDTIATRVQEAAAAETVRQLGDLDLPPGVTVGTQDLGSGPPPPGVTGYRPVDFNRQLRIELRGGGLLVSTALAVMARRSDGVGPAFLAVGERSEPLPVELRDVYPTISSVFDIKLRTWIDGVVRRLLADFEARAREVYRD
jgi:Fic family protein